MPIIDLTLTKQFHKEDPPECQRTLGLNWMKNYQNYRKIFTDGSGKEGVGSASAFFIPEGEVEKGIKLDNSMTVYLAELYAIKMALEYIKEEGECGAQITEMLLYSQTLYLPCRQLKMI